MKINNRTRISEIIKANKLSIDAIAGVAKPLERLKNPILRKVMASRVTLEEAANMGGTTTAAIAKALEPLGFKFEETDTNTGKETITKPTWLIDAKPDEIIHFDVRPILSQGTDPLKEIVRKFKEVPDGCILNIINTFIPTPLIHLLTKDKAQDSYVETISENEFHTYFLKNIQGQKNKANTGNEKLSEDDESDFENLVQTFGESRLKEIDVRAMEMPLPMQTILEELSALAQGNALYVHHKRVPVYLLEELADKNFDVHIHNIEEGNVKMLIFHKK